MALTLVGASASASDTGLPRGRIARVALMPDLPQPLSVRDWHKVTLDYMGLAFDTGKCGTHLPLLSWQDDQRTLLRMPSYVGARGDTEAIQFLAALVSGSLVGLDMRQYRGQDWVRLSTNFFSSSHGVYANSVRGGTGGSFWYDVLPNVLAFQLGALYPHNPARDELLRAAALRWQAACVALGAATNPPAWPDFNHTGFNCQTLTPNDHGDRIEPEGAAGIAWLEFMAWQRFRDPRMLQAAKWALGALERRPAEANPLYEVLLPYGAMAAVRMNAETGSRYDLPKLLNWCFEPRDRPQARPHWGVLAMRFGDYDCHGLVGSVTDTDGYAFSMNTFQWAGTLAPLARYDSSYASDLGKWLLNLTNAARLFYAAALPANHQDHRTWADQHDPESCLAYEGLRHMALRYDAPTRDVRTTPGRIVTGSWQSLGGIDHAREELESATVGDRERLEHVWEIPLSPGNRRTIWLQGRIVPGAPDATSCLLSQGCSVEGPWLPLFTLPATGQEQAHGQLLTGTNNVVYVRASIDTPTTPAGVHARLQINRLRVHVVDTATRPFATGDPVGWQWGPMNLALYGSSHVGWLGGCVTTTDQEGILQVDCLATDFFHAPAYPTHLYYNPHATQRKVSVAVGDQPVDLYDAVTHRFLVRDIHGTAPLSLAGKTAAVTVRTPAGGHTRRDGPRLLVNDVVVDWNVPETATKEAARVDGRRSAP